MATYEYKFVQLKISMWTMKPKQDYQAVIQEHARQGWRLVQIIDPSQYNYRMELVFERAL